jgi:EpsI family protein
MNFETALEARPDSRSLLIAGAIILLFAATYSQTFLSLVKMWWGSDDYTHGFLVPLISAYIIWRKGGALLEAKAEPAIAFGAIVMALAGASLVAGKLGSVVILEELSIPLMLAGLVLLLAGPLFLKALWFPIAYLLFMVKMFGEGSEKFHWPFQLLASNIGVWILQAVGIPAYKEVQYIQLPNIVLEVASACSGLRFLVSIIAIGIPLAWLTQNSWVKRVGLVAFAIFIAVLANGARVALIGVWAFYGGAVVHGPMHVFQGIFVAWIGFIALFFGAWFLSGKNSEDQVAKALKPSVFTRSVLARISSSRRWTAACVTALVILALTLAAYSFYRPSPAALAAPLSTLPEKLGDWTATDDNTSDFLFAVGGTEEFSRIYRNGDTSFRVYVSYYDEQAQGHEMVNYRNSWKLHRSERLSRVVTAAGSVEEVNIALLKENNDRRIALFWYQMDWKILANRIDVKLWTMWKALSDRRTNGAVVILSAPVSADSDTALLEKKAADLAGRLIPAVTDLMSAKTEAGT